MYEYQVLKNGLVIAGRDNLYEAIEALNKSIEQCKYLRYFVYLVDDNYYEVTDNNGTVHWFGIEQVKIR